MPKEDAIKTSEARKPFWSNRNEDDDDISAILDFYGVVPTKAPKSLTSSKKEEEVKETFVAPSEKKETSSPHIFGNRKVLNKRPKTLHRPPRNYLDCKFYPRLDHLRLGLIGRRSLVISPYRSDSEGKNEIRKKIYRARTYRA